MEGYFLLAKSIFNTISMAASHISVYKGKYYGHVCGHGQARFVRLWMGDHGEFVNTAACSVAESLKGKIVRCVIS